MDLRTLNSALAAGFSPQENADRSVERLSKDILLDHLLALQRQNFNGFSVRGEVVNLCGRQVLEPEHFALISFLDSCCSAVVKRSGFREDISQQLMQAVAFVTRCAVVDGVLAISDDHVSVRLLESLIELVVGWSDLRGRQKQAPREKLQISISSLALLDGKQNDDEHGACARSHLLNLLTSDIKDLTKQDRKRIRKLEQRLIAAEEGLIKASRSRKLAAQMINAKMEHQVLAEPIVRFLQGVWFDSAQLILTRQGIGSEAWFKVSKLTETLILTVQPENNTEPGTTKDLGQIIEHLPDELKASLLSLQHDRTAADVELAVIESQHIAVLKGEQPDSFEFEYLPVSEGLFDKNTSVSQTLLAPVEKLNTGQWFVYTLEGHPVRHIKLTLKMCDLRQLMFTNRNGVKVLQVSFDEFAYLLGSEIALALPAAGSVSSLIRARLKRLVKRQLMRDKEIKQRAKPKVVTPGKTLKKVNYVPVSAEENSANLEECWKQVSKLELGARLRIGDQNVETVEARLIVEDPAGDRVMLADPLGVDLGEYTRLQLAKLVADGKCLILSRGGGFDDFRARIQRLKTSLRDSIT